MEKLLKHSNLEASAVNDAGELVYLGKPKSVKHLNYKYRMSWDVVGNHSSVFNTLLLHDRKQLLSVIPVTPFTLTDATSLVLKVSIT